MKDCAHENFTASVAVNRMEDTHPMAFVAHVKISCVACGEPFRFLGVKGGHSWKHPTASIDGLELCAPIQPEEEKTLLSGPFVIEMLPSGGKQQ